MAIGLAMFMLRAKASRIMPHRSSSSSSPSPSPDQPEEIEKFIWFKGYNRDKNAEWYAFDVSRNDFKFKRKKKMMTKRKKMMSRKQILEEGKRRRHKIHCRLEGSPVHHHNGDEKLGMRKLSPLLVMKGCELESCVAFGTVIYSIGGDDCMLDRVGCYDFTCPSNDWKNAPSMMKARCTPRAVVLDGKIYVMGGVEREGWKPWDMFFDSVEVFDPRIEKWELLPEIPSQLTTHPSKFFCAALESSKTILVGVPESNAIYVYDVMKKTWDVFPHEIDRFWVDGQPVVVGQTLYWFARKLYAYDLEKKIWFSGSIKGLETDYMIENWGNTACIPRFFHLRGEEFCLIWSENYRDTSHNLVSRCHCRCHCVKLRVSKDADLKSKEYCLNAVAKSCQSYLLDHQFCIVDALLL
ncbi:hypothetical protein L1049_003243 [Liquidambar formosana]|uniref:FKB95-like N-terminal Kelch domain-containing protein n=1 Tax=Liquidambar formosana TaxID=63359 RepID=A0AAP0R7Z8_LIQFO